MGPISTTRKFGAALAVCGALCFSLGNDAAAEDRGNGFFGTHSGSNTAWSGVYIGGGLGAAWADTGVVFGTGLSPNPNPMELDSALAGTLHLGIQRQWGRIVGGIETSLLFGDLSGTSVCPSGVDVCSVEINRVWMIGPRLGVAAGNLHLYGTGGYALGTLQSKTSLGGSPFDIAHGRHSGWYLGGGVEWSLGRALVLGVEYKRIELDDDTQFSSTGIGGGSRDIDASIDTIQARLTFKVGDLLR